MLAVALRTTGRRTRKLDLSRTTVWLVPAIGLALGLGLAFWSVYSDYLRRRPWEPTSPEPDDPGPSLAGGSERFVPVVRWRADSLTLGLMFLGFGGLIYFLFRGRAPGAAMMGYFPALVGIGFLAAHLSRQARTESADGGEKVGED